MKYLRIKSARKLRNLSWKVRPFFTGITELDVMFFTFLCCIVGAWGTLV